MFANFELQYSIVIPTTMMVIDASQDEDANNVFTLDDIFSQASVDSSKSRVSSLLGWELNNKSFKYQMIGVFPG